MDKKKIKKEKGKLCCTPIKIKVGDSETPGYACLLGEGEDVSVNVVSKEELKKITKNAIEKEK